MAWGSAFHSTLLDLLLLLSLVCWAEPLCLPDERSALLHFKQSFVINDSASTTSGAYPKTQSWNLEEQTGRDCCSWDGVTCDNSTGHVVGLNLSSSYLYGQVPWGILELSKLEILDLSGNSLKLRKPGLRHLLHKLTNIKQLYLDGVKISSSVPNILANLSSFIALSLSNCELRGEFPTGILDLPSLQFLSLESNPELTGSLPDKIQDNHPLLALSLANTSFSGKLPESIGNFYSLEYLDISNCHFSGKLPYSLGNLSQLTVLDLFSNNFSGPVPASIGHLNQLRILEFSENKFSGQIPSSLANLTQIDYLSLAANSFDRGTLAWLGTQTNLTFLDLSSTNVTGQIPSSLQKLTQITYLYLSSNELNGQIPPWIGSLTELTEIKFLENSLSGPVPESIFKLQHLEVLYLQRNQLNGTLKLQSFLELKNLTELQLSSNHLSLLNNVRINGVPPKFRLLGLASCNLSEFPSFLHGQDELEFLELAENKIHGQIPNWFWSVGKQTLQYLNLGFNSLSGFGKLPAILPWSSLEHLILESNMFQGSLPSPPPSIITYKVSSNMLSGEITPIFCNLSSILVLDLSNNYITGKLPACLASLADSLKVLNLQNNHFIGAIPPTHPNCGLRTMDLSKNQLQGKIPRSLAHCTQLEELILGNNMISDRFPYWLGNLPKLKLLILRSNRLHGVIGKPQTKSDFSKLQVIDLSNNHLRGKLPSEYFSVWNAMKVYNTSNLSPYMFANTSSQNKKYEWYGYYNYTVTLANKGRDLRYERVPDSISAIDFSSNEFEGEIPEAIGDLKLIIVLNFSNNNLHGRIPSSLGGISNLESLDISRNNLSGKIPPQLSKLDFLEIFNVSYNKLEGPVPQGAQFNTFNNDSYEGNTGLCGYPLSEKCGNPQVPSSTPSTPDEDEDEGIWRVMKFGWTVVLTGYGAGLILGMSLGWNFDAWKYACFRKVFGKWVVSNSWSGSNWYGSSLTSVPTKASRN